MSIQPSDIQPSVNPFVPNVNEPKDKNKQNQTPIFPLVKENSEHLITTTNFSNQYEIQNTIMLSQHIQNKVLQEEKKLGEEKDISKNRRPKETEKANIKRHKNLEGIGTGNKNNPVDELKAEIERACSGKFLEIVQEKIHNAENYRRYIKYSFQYNK